MRSAHVLACVAWLAAAPAGVPQAVPSAARPPAADLRVRLTGLARAAVLRARQGAAARLGHPGCQALLGDFGGPVDGPARRLAHLGVSAQEFLDLIVFARGGRAGRCAEADVVAVTRPGSRAVYVCENRFAAVARREPETAEALLIHELLHGLGVPEDPPTSREITRRVLARCGDAALAAADATPGRPAPAWRPPSTARADPPDARVRGPRGRVFLAGTWPAS